MAQLMIPNKLYGRDQDILTLLESFERISSGRGEVLLVTGPSGVGKTALVQELKIPILGRNGFFISGKFDQYQQNIPYFAFRQALSELCRELQSGNPQQRSRFKDDILQAIGNLGQALVDLVPEFESFLGTQPPLENISPPEARHRFANVFQNFLKVICRPEHPLVLFIDDWQWADAASFELLKHIQVGITLRYLLVIVSYRDNEVDSDHPLLSTVDDLRSHFIPVEVLRVKNITVNDVAEIVAETFKPAVNDAERLASLIHARTFGNPFFLRSFFNYLNEFNLIGFDTLRNCWQWSMDRIDGESLPTNVVELFAMRLLRLDNDSRNLFSLAACLGNRFDLKTLSTISGRNPSDCLAILFSRKAKEMFLRLESTGIDPSSKKLPGSVRCAFQHDQIQQAAYNLIEPVELPHILLKIGRMLLNSLNPEQLSERLFEVVNDLNAGVNLIQDIPEQVKLVELNIIAARKAYIGTAYRSALQFYRAANRIMEISGLADYLWRECHELTLNLFKERAVCEFLEGDRNEAEKCIRQAMIYTRSALEKADTLNILIVHYTLLARYPEAIEAGRQALDTLGISLPKENYEEVRNSEIASVRQELGSRRVSSLVDLPVMSDPKMLMASKILITMGPPCYRSHQRLWGVIVPKVVNLSLKFGNIPQVGYSHTAFGGLLGWVDSDYTTAREFGELATSLMTGTFHSPADQSVFYLMIGSSIRHWFKHLRYGTRDYEDAYDIGLRSGNLQYAAYAFGHNMYCLFYQGIPLTRLIPETQRFLEFSRTRHNQWSIELLEGGLKIFTALSDEIPAKVGNIIWSEEEFLQRAESHQNTQVICIYKVLKTFSLLLAGNFHEALALSDEAESLIYTVGTQGLLPWPEHVFARFLILTSLYPDADVKDQNKWRAELDLMIGKLRIWTDNCHENFEHKYLLAKAELAKIDGRPIEAIRLYDRAVESAKEGNFLQWEGIFNERAYVFWLGCGNELLAYSYWQQAYNCYNRWGATAKVLSMETAYRSHLVKNLPARNGFSDPSDELELEIKNVFIENQINQLRNYAFQMQQSRLRIETATQAEELAKAMQRLRIEIAERKQTEEALRNSEQRFHSLFDNMDEGVALHELVFEKGKPVNYRIIDINNRFMKIIGLSREEVVGKLATSVYGTPEPPYLQEYYEVGISKKPIFFEAFIPWMNRHFAISVAAWGESGFATLFSDITDRKKNEEEIKLFNAELIKLNSEKDKFFSIIAHDLRSPFNAFLGFTRMMVEDLPSMRLDEIQKIALTMRNSATNLYRLLENLLEWSLLKREITTVNPETFLLKLKITEYLAVILEAAHKKNIELSINVPEDLRVFADNHLMATVFRNLASNAVKFTPKGGEVTINATQKPDNSVEISIKDTGIGMNKKLIDKLFRINEQVNRKGTDGEPSTGLGLILCKDFVEKQGGKIWVESEEGKGSIFYFTLAMSNIQK